MTTRRLSFYLLAGLSVILPLIFLWLPSQSGAADDKNSKSQLSENKLPPNYDALAKSPKRSAGNDQLAQQNSKPRLEGGRLVQYEPRFDVPTFLWASGQDGAKAASVDNLQEGVDKVAAARSFLSEYSSRYRLDKNDVATAIAAGVHDTGKGAIIVKFKQAVGGIEVFRDEINVVMNRELQLIALTGYLTGDASIEALSAQSFQLQPETALSKAIEDLTGSAFDASVLHRVEQINGLSADNSTGNNYIRFTADNGALQNFTVNNELLRVKKVMFHLPDEYIPAYYVETGVFTPTLDILDVSGNMRADDEMAYSYVISAVDGTVLFRNNLIDRDANYTYRVWADPTTKIPYDSPAGNSAQPKLAPTPDGAQYPFVAQTDITLQNYPFSRNDPWLPVNSTETVGNNVDAFVNLVNPDGYGPVMAVPADPATGDFRAKTTGTDQFLHTFDANSSPQNVVARQAGVAQLFYNVNFLHDWFYDSGFDEASGNSQADNYGRGGLANDSMKAQAQDVAGRNNANMLTPADGSRPRMRMYLFDTNAPKYLEVTSPVEIAGRRAIGTGTFGPQSFDMTNEIVASQPHHGCSAFTNASAVAGKIVLVNFQSLTGEPTCSIGTKLGNAMAAGAAGFILVYLQSSPNTVVNVSGSLPSFTIPFSSLSWNGAVGIKTQLAANQTVTARLRRDVGVDRDGALDNQIVFHEWGHFISNRLIGNANGLNTNHSGGMGEGWGDFLAVMLTVRPDDINVPSNANWNGAYATGNYANSGGPNGEDNQGYYFGGRRMPYSTDLTKNSMTFKHIQNGVALPNTAPVFFGQDGANNSEVHNTGEIWANMLWECYAALLRDTQGASPRLTFEEAQGRMKLYLTAAMKITPVSPTFLEGRDALIAAARAYDVTDAQLFAQAFAKRGAGIRAVAPDRYSPNNSGVVESFVTGGDLTYVGASLDDSLRSCDNDGYLDSGEKGRLTITLKNSGLEDLSNTTASISSSNPAITFPNGNTIAFPASQPLLNITSSIVVESSAGLSGIQISDFTITFNDSGLAIPGALTAHYFTRFNVNEIVNVTATDNAEVRNIVWTTGFNATLGNAAPWRRQDQSSMSVNHVLHGPNPSFASDQYLISPVLTVDGSGAFNLQFDHSWSFEFDGTTYFDGGVIEIRINGGAWTDIGGPIYNGTLANYAGNLNPLKTRSALVAASNNTLHASLTQAIAPGSTVQVRFRLGTDNAAGAGGWNVDNVAFSGVVETPFGALVADPSNCSAPVMVKFVETNLPTAFVGVSYTATLTPTGGTAPYTYSIVQPFVLPPGLTYSAVNGNLQISGTPILRGDYPVTFKINDSANNQANVSYTLSVIPATQTVSGLVVYGTTPAGDPAKYVPGVVFSATGASTGSATSNASGAYSVGNLNSSGSYVITPSKTGNVNGVTSFDATLVLRHVAAAVGVLTGNQLIAADVNNSGTINTFDATLILRFTAAGIQTPDTGETGNWKFTPASRSYSPLTNSPLDDNYTAILLGDVNGDWAPPASPPTTLAEETMREQQPKKGSLTLSPNDKARQRR